MFGVSRRAVAISQRLPPEPANIASFWAISTFDFLLNAAVISQLFCQFLLGLPDGNRWYKSYKFVVVFSFFQNHQRGFFLSRD